MKRKNIFFGLSFIFVLVYALTSCTKDESPTPVSIVAAVPSAPIPGDATVVPYTSGSLPIVLKWAGTATNAVKWDVYFGNTEKPVKVASGVAENTYTVNVTTGGTYYWKVETIDANNVKSTSAVWSIQVNSNPDIPSLIEPKVDTTNVSCTPTFEWSGSDPEGDVLTYDLYLGTTNKPAVAYTGLTDVQFAVTTSLSEKTDYYWKIVAKDPYGGERESAIRKFTTGLEPINTYVGTYKCDEPAENYSYDITFTKVNATTIKTTNYWNSSPWTGTFILDLANLTYTMANTTWTSGYSGIESGIIDPKKGTMTGTYTIWKDGVISEQGVHTYTKK